MSRSQAAAEVPAQEGVDPESDPVVLVVDDDPPAAALVARWLERAGFRPEVHGSAESLMRAFSTTLPDAVCLDLGLPGMSGQDALALIRRHHRTVPVVVTTADRDPETVVFSIQSGAYDYLAKPLERTKVVTTVRNAVQAHRLQNRVSQLERNADGAPFEGIVGRSSPMRRLFDQIARIAASDVTVLIHGESGTGKELVAQAIHRHSPRSRGPIVAVNCAAIPQALQDAELFGHEKGAFTGADQARPGRFEQSNGGTLFLDEVAELSPELQAKLLRVLQERQFERIGGRRVLTSDFRVIAATHRDLEEMVEEGSFRQDLFFRLAVLELSIPPLRERGDDIELLVENLIQSLAQEAGSAPAEVSPQALQLLRSYNWPGNVRELKNALARAVVVCNRGRIEPYDLPPRLQEKVRKGSRAAAPGPSGPNNVHESMADIERAAIVEALEATGGNLSEATRRLGIGRATLYRRLKKYGLK